MIPRVFLTVSWRLSGELVLKLTWKLLNRVEGLILALVVPHRRSRCGRLESRRGIFGAYSSVYVFMHVSISPGSQRVVVNRLSSIAGSYRSDTAVHVCPHGPVRSNPHNCFLFIQFTYLHRSPCCPRSSPLPLSVCPAFVSTALGI